MDGPALIACPDCDLLQRKVMPEPGGSTRCRRCFAILYRDRRDSVNKTVAVIVAAVLTFVIANVYPVMRLQVEGMQTATTLVGAVHALWVREMRLLAGVVVVSALLAPAAEIGLFLFILFPLKLKRRVPGRFPILVRLLQMVEPWQMLEVFMLGILVSLAKLRGIATVQPGIALWAFGALTLLLAWAAASLDPHDVWLHVDLQGTDADR